jgi:uncharacterized protein
VKYLLVLAIVFGAFWLWRAGRGNKAATQQAPAKPPLALQDMVSCAVCGVHLPQTDAVKGKQAWYCSDGHRQRNGG